MPNENMSVTQDVREEAKRKRRQDELEVGLDRSAQLAYDLRQQESQSETNVESYGEGTQQILVQEAMQLQEAAPGNAIVEAAPPATVPKSRKERKKQAELQSAREKAVTQRQKVMAAEAGLLSDRADLHSRVISEDDGEMSEEHLKKEKELLAEKLKAINLEYKLKVDEAGAGISADRKLALQVEAQNARAAAAGEYARMLEHGPERHEAMRVKEDQELKAFLLRKKLKVSRMKPEERKREEKTMSRHARYDFLRNLFWTPSSLAREDVRKHRRGGYFINKGRAFFGGTKPMYIFEDRAHPTIGADGQERYPEFLYKEAINCIGMSKPEGALVTEAASKLQQQISGDFAVKAFAVRNEDREVIGSFQEKLEVDPDGIDLFSWQEDPKTDLPDALKDEILREHTVDWLLCNFDTKGENFIQRSDGHLSSIDKEASFSAIEDEGAQSMSTTFKPNANNTLYNVIFTQYAKGKINLNLKAVDAGVAKIEAMSDPEYIAMFKRMLDSKYGKTGRKRKKIEDLILLRKQQLRQKYNEFWAFLTAQRDEALARLNAGTNAGTNVAGTNVAGTNVAGTNVAGTNVAGTNVAGTNVAGTNVAGTNVAGTNAGIG
jgi:hypothetical protein